MSCRPITRIIAGILALGCVGMVTAAAAAPGDAGCSQVMAADSSLIELCGVPTGIGQAEVWIRYVPSLNDQGQPGYAVLPAFRLTDAQVKFSAETRPRPLFGPDGRVNPPIAGDSHAHITLTVRDLLDDADTRDTLMKALARYELTVNGMSVDLSSSMPTDPKVRDDLGAKALLTVRDAASPGVPVSVGELQFKRGPAEQRLEFDVDPVDNTGMTPKRNPLYELLFGKPDLSTGRRVLGSQAWSDGMALEIKLSYDGLTPGFKEFRYPISFRDWLFSPTEDEPAWPSPALDFRRSLRGIVQAGYVQFQSIQGLADGPLYAATVRLPVPQLDDPRISPPQDSPPQGTAPDVWFSSTAPSTNRSAMEALYSQLATDIPASLPGWMFAEDNGAGQIGAAGRRLVSVRPLHIIEGLPFADPTVQLILIDQQDGSCRVLVSVHGSSPG